MPPFPPSPQLDLALVQFPGRIRRALKLYHRITGLTAVASLAASFREPSSPSALLPPVHPRCARRLRSVAKAPCGEQWLIHLRPSRHAPRARSHTCPIGLRCSCVPIQFGDRLVGVAKLVVDSRTSAPEFSKAITVLSLVVCGTSQSAFASMLAGEVERLRQKVNHLQQVRSQGQASPPGPEPPSPAAGAADGDVEPVVLVARALRHLQRHYQEPALSLSGVARALGCNPKYLTTRFTQVVGERMHTHLVALRVAHACRLLLGTGQPVKEVAYAAGFSRAERLASAFRRHVGVPPAEYRRIFAGT